MIEPTKYLCPENLASADSFVGPHFAQSVITHFSQYLEWGKKTPEAEFSPRAMLLLHEA